ncbi:uncharacterized protein EDB93DRAFT_1244612 [Suillus bovinus]|uniref:uncharacterized protein n=1 Tax=Suillus bovinus TaxID=48563 RepID=UPI001B85CD01|nr:uncharacterized protein EDB93DRAFT_1244612 [Suillus bovinus]KAG2159837.1 hypothetical protein EDB93DRAFT_1244612 [Suillus bovinus]
MSSAIPKAVLYYSPQSVWSSAVLLALSEKGYGEDEVDLKVVDINKGQEFSPTFLRLSPKAMVPTLIVPLRGSLASDVASRFKAISDTKALIEFLDKSRSQSSHTHTTSSAPAPSLSPATVAFASASSKIIDSIHADEVSPDRLQYLNARDQASLQELGKSLVPILESRRAAIVGYLTDCEQKTLQMSEKTKSFWREKQAEAETALSVFSGNDVDGYLSRSRIMWEITIPGVLTRLNEEFIGPYALGSSRSYFVWLMITEHDTGDQVSIVDIHLSAWLSHLVRLAGGSPYDNGDVAIKRVEKHIGSGGFVFPEDFLPSAFSPFTEEKSSCEEQASSILG